MKLEKIAAYESRFPKGSIIDGVVDGEKYFKSSPRIAWFLKEAYSTEDGYHIKKYYGQPNSYEEFFCNVATQTWHPIIYASYGILNGFITWDDMFFIRDKPEMCEVVKSIAIINANKFPSETGTFTTWPNLNKGFAMFKDLILDQVDALQPEINIFCGTFYLYKELFGLTEEHQVKVVSAFDSCGIWIKDDKFFLDVYHPANRSQKRQVYIDQIVSAAKFRQDLVVTN